MNRAQKAICVAMALILAVFVCYEADTYIHPRPSKAASQFANILCDNYTPVSAAANTQIVTAGNANMFVYVCSYNFNAGAADIFSMVEGTGSTCGTGTKAMVGNSTAVGGLSLATNGTINFGGGNGAVTRTTVAGNNVCLLVTTAG